MTESAPPTQELLRVLSEVAQDYAVFATDTEGRIVRWPPEAERLKGFTADEVLGKHFSLLYAPGDVGAGKPELALAVAEREGRYAEESWRRRKDGSRFWASVVVTALKDADGRLIGYAKVTRDLTRQKLAKEALRTSESQLAGMIELSLDAIISVGEDQRVVLFNKGAEAIFGFTADEIRGRPLGELIPERLRERHAEHVRQFGESADESRPMGLRQAIVGRRKDGEEFPAEASISKQSVHGVRIFTVVLRDIGPRVRVERALRRREGAIRALHQIGAHPSLDLDEKIQALLELGCQQFHLDLGVLARIVGDRWEVRQAHPETEAIHPGSVFTLGHTCCRRTLQAPEPFGFTRGSGAQEESYPAYPGQLLGAYLGVPVVVAGETFGTLSFSSLSSRDEPFTRSDQDLIRLMALWIGNELHRRQVLETRTLLAESGRVLASSLNGEEVLARVARLAVPALGDGCLVYAVAEDGIARLVEAVHVDPDLTVRLQDARGAPLEGDGHGPALEVIRSGGPRVLGSANGGEAGDDVFEGGLLGLPASQCRSVLVLPLKARGKVIGALALASAEPGRYSESDGSAAQELALRGALALDNANLYQRATEAIRMRDEVLSFVIHDLGSPLSSISMVVDRLLEVPPDEDRRERTREYLSGIRDAATRMERLINDLVEVRLLEEGRLAVRQSKVSVRALLDAVAREFQPRCEASSLDFELAADDPGFVRADRDRVRQVLSNLLDNAVKFTDPGGRITVRVEGREEEILFSVADTGIGIRQDRLASVFNRYAQAQEARRAGAGLGLAIAKEIVEAHGGAIRAESEPGVGSTFFFTLPRA